MRRTLNKKLVLGLLIAILALGLGTHTLHGFQVKRSAKILLELASDAEEQGDLVASADHLGHYLGLVPDDADALVRYAVVLGSDRLAATVPGRIRALAVADKALIRAPHRRDVRRKAVDLAMALHDYDAARSHLMILLEATADDGELESLLGACEEGRGQFAKAAAWYEKAIGHAPKQVDVYVRLANLLRQRLNEAGRADRVMDAIDVKAGLIAANGGSFRAYLERARYRRAHGLAGADADVARALALAPDEADVLLMAAESARDRGDRKAARAHLERGLERHPSDARIYQAVAALESQAGRYADAAKMLKRGIEAVPEPTGLRWTLAEMLVEAGEAKDAAEVLGQLRAAAYPAELLGYLDARLDMAAGRWSRAITTLESSRARLSTRPGVDALLKRIDLLLAECYREIGNVDQQYNACLAAVAIVLPDDPLEIPAHLALASALAAMGQVDGAIDEFRKVVALPKAPPEAGIDLAQMLLLRNQGRPAAERRWDEIESLLDGAGRAAPESAPRVAALRAEVHVARDRLEEARALLEKARDRAPEQVSLWTALALLAVRQGKPQEGLALLDRAQERLGDGVALRLARAMYWERRGGPEAAKALAALEQGAESFPPDDRERLLSGLAGTAWRMGDDASARRLWTRIVTEWPEDLHAHYALFELAFQARDSAEIERHLQELRRIEGEDGTLWRFGRARALIRQARVAPGADRAAALAEARTLVAPVAARRPAWSDVARAEAELDDLQGNPDSALRHYERAIELGDRGSIAPRRAIELLVERKRFEEADRLLRRLEARVPLSPALRRLAAGVALQLQDDPRALELARAAVPPEAADYRDQLWLGQILAVAAQKAMADGKKEESEKRRGEAEQAYRRAVALGDDRPEAWVALVRFLAATGQAAAADRAFREAEAALPKVLSPLTLAQCYAVLGRAGQADALYREALKAAPDDVEALRLAAKFYVGLDQAAAAEPPLRRLIDLGGGTPDGAWARRVLAQLLAARGGAKGAVEALELLGPSPAGGGDAAAPLDERRARANVLARQPLRSRRREAIGILEEIAGRGAATANDLSLLGQLHEKDGDWPRGRIYLQKLMEVAQRDRLYPMYMANYARALVRHGALDEAEVWQGRLEQSAPGTPAPVEIKARVLVARNRPAEAVALLMDYVQYRDSQVAAAAAVLEELGQAKAAEVLYRRLAALPGPQNVLSLAKFLARQDRLPEALDVCEGAWKTCPAGAVAQTCLVVLYAAPRDDAQIRRVERWLDEAIHKEPGTASLQFDLASLWCLEGRYDDAEAIYRRVSERMPNNAVPLNNLAWLIAARGSKATEALDTINRAIALGGPQPDFLGTRGVVLLALGRSKDAIADLEEVIAVDPTASHYLDLARAHLMAGDRAAAAEAFQAAKAAGLRVEALHPLERAAYARLDGELARR